MHQTWKVVKSDHLNSDSDMAAAAQVLDQAGLPTIVQSAQFIAAYLAEHIRASGGLEIIRKNSEKVIIVIIKAVNASFCLKFECSHEGKSERMQIQVNGVGVRAYLDVVEHEIPDDHIVEGGRYEVY